MWWPESRHKNDFGARRDALGGKGEVSARSLARVIDEKFMRRPGLTWKHCGWTKYRVIYKYTESLNYIISKS